MAEKYIQLAKKLNELAKRGVGGEKVNAERMLNELLKKHNLSMDDIEVDDLNDYIFQIDKLHAQLFVQIVGMVNREFKIYGPFPQKTRRKYRLKGNYMIPCSNADFIHISAMVDFYKRLFNEELELFTRAFVAANELYPNAANPTEVTTQSKEDQERWKREQLMARYIKSMRFHKQLVT